MSRSQGMSDAATIKLIGTLFLLVGLGLSIVGLIWVFKTREFVNTAYETTGRVVELKRNSGGRKTTFAPVFRFKDRAGNEFTVTSSTGSTHPSHKVGEKVTVLYDPRSPGVASIKSFRTLWLGPTVIPAFGFCFLFAGTFVFLAERIEEWRNRRFLRQRFPEIYR